MAEIIEDDLNNQINGSDPNTRTDAKEEYKNSEWKYLGKPGFSEGLATDISLIVSKEGDVLIAYSDASKNDKTTVMQYTGKVQSGWEPYSYGLPGFSPGRAASVSLDINGKGTPFVAFSDFTNKEKVTVMKFNGNGLTGWDIVGNPGFSRGIARSVSIAIDQQGTPFVAFQDMAKDQKLTVMKFTDNDDTGWEVVGKAGFTPRSVFSPSLKLDKEDIPHVVYSSGESESKISVVKYTGEGTIGWQTLGLPMFSNEGDCPSLAFDRHGTACVAFRDFDNEQGPTVMRHTGAGTSGWELVGKAGLSCSRASEITLAIEENGTPLVAYADMKDHDKINVKRFVGNVATCWETIGTPTEPFSKPLFLSLAIDVLGKIYVGYQDWNNGRRASVIYSK